MFRNRGFIFRYILYHTCINNRLPEDEPLGSKHVEDMNCLFVFLALLPTVIVFSQPGKRVLASSFSRFLDHTKRRATIGRTPLDG